MPFVRKVPARGFSGQGSGGPILRGIKLDGKEVEKFRVVYLCKSLATSAEATPDVGLEKESPQKIIPLRIHVLFFSYT